MLHKKSLGQNFLTSHKIIDDIVLASGAKADDNILEIGPGEGILTGALLATGSNVVSVEKDDRLIPILSEKFEKEISSGQFTLIHKDILEISSEEIFTGKKYNIVANIPYYITGQIIRQFLESKNQPNSMTLLLQKEVAERIVARDNKESLLSLSVKVYGTPTYVRMVGRGAFSPQPNVDSAVLHISNISKSKLNGADEKKFFEIIHAGFAHKRKQLLPNLTSLFEKQKLISVFEKINLDQKSRSEDLPLETWVLLTKLLTE
ncbi:MAG: 16S rRNA (adenine(1518)-N(6)/adenine(1519)-N(6))-dimethyltransferase RsmA [bacterium]